MCSIKTDASLFSAWLAVKNSRAKLKLAARSKSKSKQLQNRVTVQALTIGAFAADAGVDGPCMPPKPKRRKQKLTPEEANQLKQIS